MDDMEWRVDNINDAAFLVVYTQPGYSVIVNNSDGDITITVNNNCKLVYACRVTLDEWLVAMKATVNR